LATVAVLFINLKYCSFAHEVKAYVIGKESFYYYGPKYCPATWSFKSITVNTLKDLASDKDIIIISQKESPELEEALEKKFLSFSRFVASDENVSFIIYETECQKCKN
jgi:hypothetical protein